jgi:HlyD family secretion protein
MPALMKITLAAGIAVAALAVSYNTIGNTAPKPDEKPQETVAAPAPAPKIVALGRVEPISGIIRVSGPSGQDAGRLAEIRVVEGAFVERGTVLAVLDTEPRLKAQLAQAEANLLMKRAILVRVIADLENQEKTVAATLRQQETQRDRAKWDLDKLQALQKSGLYKDTALVDKRLALEAAQQALEGSTLNLQRASARNADGRRIDEIASEAEITAAEAAVAKARADFAFSQIVAPISGRVLSLSGKAGQQIGEGGLLELADTRRMRVRAEVFETDLDKIRLGSSAEMTSRALPKTLHGQIDRIGLQINRQSVVGDDQAASIDARIVEVTIILDEPSSALVADRTSLQVRTVFIDGVSS